MNVNDGALLIRRDAKVRARVAQRHRVEQIDHAATLAQTPKHRRSRICRQEPRTADHGRVAVVAQAMIYAVSCAKRVCTHEHGFLIKDRFGKRSDKNR